MADQPERDPTQDTEPQLSLVLPCYNEEEVLATTVRRLVGAFRSYGNVAFELVLVDNGSGDATGQVIDTLIAEGHPVVKVVVPENQGYGYGVLRGLRVCRGRLVGFVCADGQVDPHDVVKVYDIAAQARTPKVVKVRRRFRMDGFTRKITSIVYNGLTAVMFGGLGSIDLNGNPKILPRTYLERMDLQSRDWFLDAEVLIKAKRLGLPVFELNVIAQLREGGRSNVRLDTCREFLVNLLHYRFGGPRSKAAFHTTGVQPSAVADGRPPRKGHEKQ
jgi:glycosyltransferase involved in cell wall biosynthesis